jgi:amidase
MIRLPSEVHPDSHMPFGLALMGTGWSEGSLIIKWDSAIEDLQLTTDGAARRNLPNWYGYLKNNILVLNL